MIKSALKLEKEGYRVAIVTNDQGKELIDTELARANGLESKEVTGGCFCCQFDDLYNNLNTLMKEKTTRCNYCRGCWKLYGSCCHCYSTVKTVLCR
ncbi:GTP-binding protein [Bacillus cereus]|uniref:GTP-binding protein n=1 Tax=Bacillus cereus TaxID=1396 RepID=UPI003BF757B5